MQTHYEKMLICVTNVMNFSEKLQKFTFFWNGPSCIL